MAGWLLSRREWPCEMPSHLQACARAQKRMTLKATLRTTKRALQVETSSRKEIRSASYAASDFAKTGLHLRRTPRIESTAYAESALPLFRRLWKFQVGTNHLEHSLGFCLDFERLSLWNCEVHNVNCNWRLFNRATGTLICIIFIVSIVLTWQLEILLTYRTYLSHTPLLYSSQDSPRDFLGKSSFKSFGHHSLALA